MTHLVLKSLLVLVLSFGFGTGAFAQKGKIKDKRKTSTDSTATPRKGKAALKEQMGRRDSTKSPVKIDATPAVVQMPEGRLDSLKTALQDSQRKPAKRRFYTRVKESNLVSAEQRVAGMRARLDQAEDDLETYRMQHEEESAEPTFTKEELEGFEVSIAAAWKKLNAADSSLVAVRERLQKEGRLGITPTSAESNEDDGDNDEDDDGEGAMEEQTLPATGGGKGALKGRNADAPKSGKGKGKIKRSQEMEEDIDDD